MNSNAGIVTEYSGIYGVDISVASASATTETRLAPFLLKVQLLQLRVYKDFHVINKKKIVT